MCDSRHAGKTSIINENYTAVLSTQKASALRLERVQIRLRSLPRTMLATCHKDTPGSTTGRRHVVLQTAVVIPPHLVEEAGVGS